MNNTVTNTLASPTDPETTGYSSTGSPFTRLLGGMTIAGLAVLLWLALVGSPAEANMGDSVRIMYVHVPSAIAAYGSFAVTAFGGAMYLWKRSLFWDLAAGAAAEIGVLFTALTLLTGMLWGRPTWGVYWVWDARLTSTALLLLLFAGYLAVRNLAAERHVRARRAAIVGLIAFLDVPLVRYSVDWWRSLHQPATLTKLDPDLDGLMLFTLVFGIFVFSALVVWLLIHRFRVLFLQDQMETEGFEAALVERRAEGLVTSAKERSGAN